MTACRLRARIDVDGVLGDFPREGLRFCNLYGRSPGAREWTIDDITQHDILKALGCEHLQKRFDQHMVDTDFCRYMPVYPGAQDFIEELKRFSEVVVVTKSYAAVPGWEHARRAWLKQHFGIEKRDIVFASRKELVPGDLLLDDKLENIEAWHAAWPWGAAVVFDRPWNQGTHHQRAIDYTAALEQALFVKRVTDRSRATEEAMRDAKRMGFQ